MCLAGIVTSILDEDRVSSGTAVAPYLCHDANIHHARGPSGGHAQRFFISHRFDLQPLLLRRNRKEAHDAVSTMFLSCVRQDLIMSSTILGYPRIENCGYRARSPRGRRYAMLLLRIHGELEAFRAWTGAGSAGHAPGAPQKVSTPAGICLFGGDTDPPSRSARSLAQKSLSDGYAVRDDRARPSTPFSPMA